MTTKKKQTKTKGKRQKPKPPRAKLFLGGNERRFGLKGFKL